jgi:hypothetical protein
MNSVEREFLKGVREGVAVRWTLPPHAAEVMVIFGFPHGADAPDFMLWRSYDDGRIELFADCSDTFAWATADSELIEEKDMPLLRQCFDDLCAVDDSGMELAALFAARKRKAVPIVKYLATVKADVRPLFTSITK